MQSIGRPSLPEEVWVLVFGLMGIKDLANCGLVSSQWKRIAEEPSLWRNLLQRHVGVDRKGDYRARLKALAMTDRRIREGIGDISVEYDEVTPYSGAHAVPKSNGQFLTVHRTGRILCCDVSTRSWSHQIPPLRDSNLVQRLAKQWAWIHETTAVGVGKDMCVTQLR